MQPILKQFQSYLKGLKSNSSSVKPLSHSSIKNYVSDVNFFLTWLANQANQTRQPNQARQTNQTNQPNQANQANQTRQTNQVNQANQTRQTNQANQVNQANQTRQTNQTNQPNQARQTNQANQANQPNQTRQTNQANQANQANQTRQTNQANQPNQTRQTNQNSIKPNQITPNKCQAYKNFLQENTPPATANRRLSSLRRLTAFLVATKQLSVDPTHSLNNLQNTTFPTLLNQFETYLKSQNLTPSTIKNYLSDLKNYLLWARKNIKTTDGDLAPRSWV